MSTKSTKSLRLERPLPRTLPAQYDWKTVEETVRRFWHEIDVQEKIREKLSKKKLLGYVEGPPTLNGRPHMGNVRGRTMKDVWYRSSTLKGMNILFRGGWDCQGLPVELEAEAELGLTGSKYQNLQKVGMEAIIRACKEILLKYEKAWKEADKLLGLLIDHEAAYYTYKDDYIEREWKYLEKAWDKGLLGEGYRVVPYCPSCQTSLSQHEVAQGYETLEDPSVYYKVRLEDGGYALVWTTMPFTVVTDEMLAVHPDAEYVVVDVSGEQWVFAASRMRELARELGLSAPQVVRKILGKELEGMRYEHPFLDKMPGLGKLIGTSSVHRVVAEEFVDLTTGSGIVHLSPANGEEDFEVAKRRNVPIFSPFDDRGYFSEDAGFFSGRFARETDGLVVEVLKERGSLVKAGTTVHEYPTCWRSHHRLLWLARREYFYWADRFRDELVGSAENVDYFFDQPKNRFLEFVRQAKPWCVSRERVWGTPLPIWVCESCREKTAAFSRKRILELALELPDGPSFELHRPWVDRVTLKCEKCGGRAVREAFVLDTWHNSGSAPYASMKDDEYEKLVPVPFLVEGIDQTRGWAYTLLILNVLMRKESPYRAFLFYGLVLDEQGRKMSKSLGNVIEALSFLKEYSVDLGRFYLMWKASPIDFINLSLKEMQGRPFQVLNTLYHLHLYLVQNSSLDSFNPSTHDLQWAEKKRLLKPQELWLLAKLSRLVEAADQAYSKASYQDVCREADRFVIEILSQAYVPMVRQELWDDSELGKPRRLAIYAVLAHCLKTVDQVLHPVAPYLTEYLFQTCLSDTPWTGPLMLLGWPKLEEAEEMQDLEEAVDSALKVLAAANSARMKAGVKRRWPLNKLSVLTTGSRKRALSRISELVSSLCNVKAVRLHSSVASFPAKLTLHGNRGELGALFKRVAPRIGQSVDETKGSRAWSAYVGGKTLRLQVDGKSIEVPASAYELTAKVESGFAHSAREDILVVLDVHRDDSLIAEGLVRDVARRLQSLRKERGYNPTLVLDQACVSGLDDEFLGMLTPRKRQLAYLVRAKKVKIASSKWMGPRWQEVEMEGQKVYIDIY